MDFPAYTHHYLVSSGPFFSFNFVSENYVHWSQTPESHLYSVHLPGVRKEEIRVDLEDSRFLIIRTEQAEGSAAQPAKSFYRKFRLPDRIELGGISAAYEDGVLTVTVPRTNVRRRGFYIDPADIPERLEVLARAA
uniref:SHSP domain-containing protein n=1 Tax=Kalanchoe fedtschenkoi TaxID=63787 RepID=A0A7N0RFL7_KALFE